jgi:phage N-6-adenine-methyltransferase
MAGMTALFEVFAADVADTSDDWFTPRWLFDAAGLVFDVDVAAPVDPSRRTCPARAYLTPIEDGLASPWHGIAWCNPPYSNPAPWIERFAVHSTGGMMLVPAASAMWLGRLAACADAIALVRCEFGRPDGTREKPRGMALVLAARGDLCVSALARVAAADKYAGGAYHVRPVEML